ncbi:peptidase M50 [Longimycelium tulufanense]|uniref:Peptidase M50 n=1 Tax=Longimycelium tulufanense TaxID=907463 RepID=A0A8J3FVA4_9PSEU|nr:site-2 protease family protein [Longimycelium tulufanense]GGM66470.1 peptidase M50 [Longimycelium tulufanense]
MTHSHARLSPLFLAILAITVIGGFLATLADTVTIGIIVLVLGGWAVSLCLHEFGHAIVAYRGGDFSVRDKGYLTLDIRRYTDPIFSLLIPLLLLALGGIPLFGGAVWINHHALRSRRVESMVSLAGPATNLALGILLTAAVANVPMPPGLAFGLSFLALIQIFAFVLNILPVPGLDGFGIWEPWVSPKTQHFAEKARPWAPLILFAALIGLPPVRQAFFTLSATVFDVIGGDRDLAGGGAFYFSKLMVWD